MLKGSIIVGSAVVVVSSSVVVVSSSVVVVSSAAVVVSSTLSCSFVPLLRSSLPGTSRA